MLENKLWATKAYKFKRFSDGMLPKWTKSTSLTFNICAKIHLHFYSRLQNANLNPVKYKTNQNNDQCEIVAHNLEVPELFHGPYPYEKFDTNQIYSLKMNY